MKSRREVDVSLRSVHVKPGYLLLRFEQPAYVLTRSDDSPTHIGGNDPKDDLLLRLPTHDLPAEFYKAISPKAKFKITVEIDV